MPACFVDTKASFAACASKYFSASITYGSPVSLAISAIMSPRAANSKLRIHSRPNGGAAECEFRKLRFGFAHAADRMLNLARVAAKLLTEADRRG